MSIKLRRGVVAAATSLALVATAIPAASAQSADDQTSAIDTTSADVEGSVDELSADVEGSAGEGSADLEGSTNVINIEGSSLDGSADLGSATGSAALGSAADTALSGLGSSWSIITTVIGIAVSVAFWGTVYNALVSRGTIPGQIISQLPVL